MTSQVARAGKLPIDRAATASHRLARWVLTFALAGIIVSPSAFASPIQYDYSGVITSAPASSGIVTGTPFSGSFWYDPSQNVGVGFEGFSEFTTNSASPDAAGISLSIGGIRQALGPSNYFMTFEYTPANGPSDPTPPSSKVRISDSDAGSSLTMTLLNPNGNVLNQPSSLAAPSTLSLSDFTTAQLDYIQETASGNLEFQGTITAMAAVPEPASAMLCCLAAGWLMSQQRRRRRRTMSLASQK